jgi:hypothetical protein
MRFANTFLGLVLLFGAGPNSAQSAPDGAGSFTFAAGRISFIAPPGFTPLTAEELRVKFPAAGAPRNAVGNERRTTTIAYDLLDQRAPSNDLEGARTMLVNAYEQSLRGLDWVATDVRRIGPREWAYLEFVASAADQDIHNLVLLSVYDGRVLLFNFNSTVAEFPEVEDALLASIASIAASH